MMSDGRVLVRPWFAGASTVVLILLIPVLAQSTWDYIEMRRLDAAIVNIERSGQPVHAAAVIELAGPAADADRYYRAAAALASGRGAKLMSNELASRISSAERNDVWPPELVAELRSWVDSYDEALTFADRAAVLPFEGFAAGRTFSYFTADLVTVLRAEGYRAAVRALSGDAEGAVASLRSEASLERPLAMLFATLRLIPDLRVVFAHVRASAGSLANLGRALAEADHDDLPKRELIRMRASFIERGRTERQNLLLRPWTTHIMNRALAAYADMIAASDRPWPERIDAVVASEYFPSRAATGRAHGFIRPVMEAQAERLALLRVGRVAVAIEQHERDHDEERPATLDALIPTYLPAVPVDPFSGRPLRFLTDSRGYTVYSVGRNRRDDGGRDLGHNGADLGIRIEP
jgi:hypothetical protein